MSVWVIVVVLVLVLRHKRKQVNGCKESKKSWQSTNSLRKRAGKVLKGHHKRKNRHH